MERMKRKSVMCLPVLLFLLGVGLILYPIVSNYRSTAQQAESIADYTENTLEHQTTQYETLLSEAEAYNEELARMGNSWRLSEEEKESYRTLLRAEDSDVMSYLEIPAIDCSLPVYHGTEEAVLQKGVGHLEGSSLPVGGESTHCVLAGHNGLPSAKLFTDIDRLKKGDIFLIHTFDRILTYEVDGIFVVEPTDFSKLQIEEGKDYCTLLTCTPYGVNSHRLLVRGIRAGD